MTIKILTDSTADLDHETINQWDIHVVPLRVQVDGKEYLDRVDITPVEYIKLLKQSRELPKTSQPSMGTFIKKFEELTADGSEVIAIHLSTKLSGTYSTAKMAAEQVKGKVTVIDSLYISKALTYQVVEAAKMAKEGKTTEEIVARLEEIRKKTGLYLIVDTLEYLDKGGRIGKGKAMLGSLLRIKPIAALKEGTYTPVSMARSYSQGISKLFNIFLEDVEGKKIKGINMVHADGEARAVQLREKIQSVYQQIEIKIEDTTPIISTHTGPGAIALMYYTD